MMEKNLIVELHQRFKQEEFAWLILALHQDALIWHTLDTTDLGEKVLGAFPAEAESWTPAAIALLMLDYPTTPEILQRVPVESIGKELKPRTDQAYEYWINSQNSEDHSLENAVLVALAIRERRLLRSSWNFLNTELKLLGDNSPTIMACLYGMIPDPFEFILALIQAKNCPISIKLSLHALLSNPLSPESLAAIIKLTLSRLNESQCHAVLDELKCLRPSFAITLARNWLGEHPVGAAISNNLPSSAGTSLPDENIDDLNVRSLRAALLRISEQPNNEISELNHALTALDRLRAHLNARKAGAHSRAMLETGETKESKNNHELEMIAGWRKATLLDPDVSIYSLGLALALMESGNVDEAQSLLTHSSKPDPAALSVAGLLAARSGLLDKARNMIQLALPTIQDSAGIKDILPDLAQLALDLELYPEAARACQIALQYQQDNPALLASLSQAQLSLGKFSDALFYAYLACALAPEQEKYRRIRISCLTSTGEWEAAWENQSQMVEHGNSGCIDDVLDLADYALHAGHIQEAIQACQQAMQLDQKSGRAFYLLGLAAQLLGDHSAALDNFQSAIHHAPHLSGPWIASAQLHEALGEENEAIEILNAGIRSVPDSAEIHLATGKALLKRNAATQALIPLRRAASLAFVGGQADSRTIRPMGRQADLLRDEIAFSLAEALKSLGHLDEACQLLEKEYFSEQRTVTPSMEYSYSYAKLLISLGRFDQALPVLDIVLSSHPNNPSIALDLARALLASSDQPANAKNAIPHLHALLSVVSEEQESADKITRPSTRTLDPSEQAEAFALLAEALNTSGDAESAIIAYRQALDSCLIQDSAWRCRLTIGLGEAAMSSHQYETAVSAFMESLEIDHLNPATYRKLSEAYEALALNDNAYQAALETLHMSDNDPDTLVWFAEQSLALGEYTPGATPIPQDLAISSLEHAIQLAPQRADLLILLGRLYINNGNREPAIDTFNLLTSENNDELKVSPDDLYQAALCLRTLGELDQAAGLLTKAIQLSEAESGSSSVTGSTTQQLLYVELSTVFQQSCNLEKALNALDRAIEISPDQFSSYLSKSRLHLEMNQVEQAISSLEMALQLDSSDPVIHIHASLLRWVNGNLPLAFIHAQKAIQVAKESKNMAEISSAYFLAADLMSAMMLADQGFTLLEQLSPEERSVEMDYLLAEYLLEKGKFDRATEAFAPAVESSPQSAHTLAVQARLAAQKDGLIESGLQLLKYALDKISEEKPIVLSGGIGSRDSLGNAHITQDYYFQLIEQIHYLATLRCVGRAAIELGQYCSALDMHEQISKIALPEARTPFERARIQVLCAESQNICQALSIIQHAPGESVLSDAARESCELSLHAAREMIQTWISDTSQDTIEPYVVISSFNDGRQESQDQLFQTALQTIDYWTARAHFAYTPNIDNAEAFLKYYDSAPSTPQEAAIRVQLLSVSGDLAGATAVAELFNYHPLVSMVLALALAETDRPKAVEIILQSLRMIDQTGLCIPNPIPSLQALLAKLYIHSESTPQDQMRALDSVQAALLIWPDEPRWHALAADLIKDKTMQPQDDHYELTLNHLKQACLLEPENAQHFLKIGEYFLEHGEVDQAIQPLEMAIQLDSDLHQAWLSLAMAQKESGYLEKALSSAVQAGEKGSDSLAALLLQGEINLLAGNPTKTLNRAKSVLQIQPDYPQGLYLLSRAMEELDNPEEALVTIDRAILLAGDNFEMQLSRARLLMKTQSFDAALPYLQDLVIRYPDEPRLMAMMSECYVGIGQINAAVQSAHMALQTGQKVFSPQEQSELHFLIGEQARRAGQLDQAIHYLSEALRISPNWVDAYLELGKAYQERRQNSQAMEVFMAAAKIAPTDYRPYYQAGMALKDSRDYLEAETMLRHAAHLAPQEVNIHRQLGAVVALNLVHNRRMVSIE